MIRVRSAISILTAALLVPACEPVGDQAAVALAGFAAPGSATVEDTWQGTVTRRIRWGPGIDVMVAPFSDGERMAAIDWATGDVAVYTLATGEMKRLTEQPAPYVDGVAMFPVVSPDGRRITYSWQDYRENLSEIQLRVIGTEGGAPEQLYRGPPSVWINAWDWSRDGSRVLALRMLESGEYEIVVVSPADGAATAIRTLGYRDPTQVRFSPDGRFIAYDYPIAAESDDRDIFVLAADGSSETVLVRHPANDRLLGWAPDGRSILFLSDRAGTPGAWLVPVADGRADGEPYLVKPDMWNTEPIGFDRDGRYFYGVGVGARAMHEATFAADGRSLVGEPRDLTSRTHQEVQRPRWSPDGQYIAFVLARQGPPPGLMIRSLESGDEREVRLDRRLSYFYDLEWLPDGRSLVAIANDERQQRPLLKIDVRTGETSILLQSRPWEPSSSTADVPELISGVAPSPDGRTLYVTLRRFLGDTPAVGEEQILAYDIATGALRLVHDGDPTRPIRSLVISPDGRTLAFSDGVVSADPTITVLPLDGGSPRAVAHGLATSIGWTPDGRALLVSRPLDDAGSAFPVNRLERVDVATGEVTLLGLERKGLGVTGRFDFHPDGRRAVFIAGALESEWWVMEGFLGAPSPPGGNAGRGN